MEMELAANLVALSGARMIAYGIAFLVCNFTGFIELGLTAELLGGTRSPSPPSARSSTTT